MTHPSAMREHATIMNYEYIGYNYKKLTDATTNAKIQHTDATHECNTRMDNGQPPQMRILWWSIVCDIKLAPVTTVRSK